MNPTMDTIILEPFVFLILKLTLLVKKFKFYIFVVMKEKILELRINGKSMKQIIREGNYKGLSVIEEDAVIDAAKSLLPTP